MSTHTNVAIIGAGPAGMIAAARLTSLKHSVIVLDEQPQAGGQIWRNITHTTSGLADILGPDYTAGASVAGQFAASGAQHLRGATVWNLTRERQLHYLHQGKSYSLTADAVILATGAMERPFPIPGWTLPGVMGAGAAQVLLKGAGTVPAAPVVIAGCGPLLYLICWQYLRANVQIAAVLDTSSGRDIFQAGPALLGGLAAFKDIRKGLSMINAIKAKKIPFYRGVQKLRINGQSSVRSIAFEHQGQTHELETSLVLLHQGVVPNTQFTWLLRAAHDWSDTGACWIPKTDGWGRLHELDGIYLAGDGQGIAGAQAAVTRGELAALAVDAQLNPAQADSLANRSVPLQSQLKKDMALRPFLDAAYLPKRENRLPQDDTIVCRCEEVTAGQIRDFVRQGCMGPNQAKSFSRCGMGPCQGRLCGLTVTEVIADQLNVAHDQVGYYRIRAPLKPVTLAELACATDSEN
ncbi:NAD(P)/FAD-dependent oxidoreductase [Advenella mimigardefordensis]|uniref:Opine oxidase subunit A n=1 Tax=Advenella mimigardefordensis (strain DSM 17166 / LMG 22922 / DPN7) TaxID=1247726 RepID=W0PBU3_ADVMD|nr:FAD/NAD(P)-binding oxidoreductase [Advenella mimigardefordensis]AHG62962.1 opine oxidase subunit A [Advenella mimigardefordensis DPN7]